MKKSIILLLSALLAMRYAHAQSPDSALATVHYNLSQIIDTTMRDAVKVDDMVLFLGKQSSLSTSYDEMQKEAKLAEIERQHPGSVNGLTLSYGMPFTFYKNMTDKKLVNRAKFRGDNYIIQEIMPSQEWKITEETKNIQGI